MSRSTVAAVSRTNRCAISNGTRRFLDADGRSAPARLLRDREAELAAPLGGLEALALADRAKVEAAALLSVRLETARSALARGEAGASDEDLVRLTNGLSRALAALDKLAATRARARTAAPSVAEYLAKRAEAAA